MASGTEHGEAAMERQPVIPLAQYYGVTRERFLQDIYPLVGKNCATGVFPAFPSVIITALPG